MELYARKVTIFDEQILDDFSKEHQQYQKDDMSGDCSLILGTSYLQIGNFYDWYQQVENLHQEQKLKKGQVGCTTYLVLTKEKDKLIALFDIRHSLNYENGDVYGHIGVEIRPKERHKGQYKNVLKLALEATQAFDIKQVVISCEYDNIASKKGIEHIFGKEYESIPRNGTYFLVYKKEMEIR